MSTALLNEIKIKEMSSVDIPHVVCIEAAAYQQPWTAKQFSKWLKKNNVVGFVATVENTVAGFIIAEIFSDFFNLIDIATHPDYRRKGIGSSLIKFIVNQLRSTRRSRLTASVRETNLPAQLFFRDCGLRAVEVLKGQYKDSDEACYKMEYRFRWPAKSVKNDTKGWYAKQQ